ncbi:transposase DNA-binding-containing protein [Agrobacterium radiobacter]|uniref:Transposase DNA-binding-containing protein n=1 Tax=Agrobacterium radiobacter TaxID=362 RepID=A0ABD5LLL4_AGRRD
MSVRDDVIAYCGGHWSKQEMDAECFKDARVGRRCTELLRQLGEHMGGSIPFGCQGLGQHESELMGLSNRSWGVKIEFV